MVRDSTPTEPNRPSVKTLLLVGLLFASVLAIGVAGVVVSSDPAEARFPIDNVTNIEDRAVLNTTSNSVLVFGTTSCTAGEIVEVHVNVTQNSTGAVATGETAAYCLGEQFVQPWISFADSRGETAFEPGDARVDAWARTQVDGETTDRIVWNGSITLARTYPNVTRDE